MIVVSAAINVKHFQNGSEEGNMFTNVLHRSSGCVSLWLSPTFYSTFYFRRIGSFWIQRSTAGCNVSMEACKKTNWGSKTTNSEVGTCWVRC